MTCPSVLLMDEPTEGLAPQIVAEVGKIITELRSLGLSIVLVEQHTNFALRLADDVVIINTGEIVARAKASEIVANNELIQAYLGVH
jgi:branched-chain amino acid transport system ATP-binding protein